MIKAINLQWLIGICRVFFRIISVQGFFKVEGIMENVGGFLWSYRCFVDLLWGILQTFCVVSSAYRSLHEFVHGRGSRFGKLVGFYR